MKVVGLTGGIASGKSAISSYLKKLGIHIIDADQVARQVVKPNTDAWREIVDFFGIEILLEDSNINRKLLGEKVFRDPKALAKLNQITHPRILRQIVREVEAVKQSGQAGSFIVVDAPLLIETGLYKIVDEVWVVYITLENQLKRLMNRDGISREEASRRIQSQMPLEEKLNYAHRVIDNNGPLVETFDKVQAIVKKLSTQSTSVE